MALVQIRPGVAFRADAAASFRRLEAAAGRPLDVNRTTESGELQQRARDAYLAYLDGGPWAPLALDPDDSLHVYREDDDDSATAWDTDERGAWIEEHGWIADVPGEPWHREYRRSRDKHRNTPTPTPTTNTLGEEPMMIRIKGKAGARRGGLYVVLAGAKPGTYTATYAGNPPAPDVPLIDDEVAIGELQKRIGGLR